MINSLTGEITHKGPNVLFLSMAGVEWELWVTGQTLSTLPEVGRTARIFTYLHHREDQMRLFGFANSREKQLFLDLIKVGTVGPVLALKILSGIKAEAFIAAVESEDLATLIGVPGLGRKTAQKIVLQLKGKLVTDTDETLSAHGDIVTALAGMGFDKRAADKAVAEALKALRRETETDRDAALEGASKDDFERELLKRSINLLSRGS